MQLYLKPCTVSVNYESKFLTYFELLIRSIIAITCLYKIGVVI